jgi:chromosomal replication initiator protein
VHGQSMNVLDIWQKVQQPLRAAIGDTSYDTWFSNVRAVDNQGAIMLQTPDEFFKNWIVEHYGETIERCVRGETSLDISVTFEVNAALVNKPVHEKLNRLQQHFDPGQKTAHLNSRFLFEHFVVGPSNRFACAAAQAVAESPAKAYNPLFIYGPVGLGKTHLMQAITHEVGRKHPELKCCYISSEQFTNELINAIRHRSAEGFRQKYRNIDVLLIDDIHFIAGKESTQEEFFHTFNVLHDHRKQIIICSDRPPKEIANLEERLVSRFAWGLITDIQPPDFETRSAILKKKLELESVVVPDDVINFIASEIKTNIRELEGALIRVVAYALLEEKPITLQVAKNVLKDMVRETIKTISVEMVQKEVAAYFHIPVADLKTKKRHKNIILPRQLAMYLARKHTTHSLPEIGAAFGGKDHTTILHAFKKIEGQLLTDKEIRNTVDKLNFVLLE